MYHINKEITGSGENIALKNTAKQYFKDFGIFGNSKQETRQGYNLIDEIEYGTINYETGQLGDSTQQIRSKNYIPIDTSLTYYFYRNLNKVTTAVGFRYYDENYTYLGSSQLPVNTKDIFIKLTGTDKATAKYFKFTCQTSVIDGDYMFAQSNVALPYEKYGMAPTLAYDAPIQSVGDDINLFDKNNANILKAFPNGDTLIISAHAVAKILFIECEGNTTYTISKKPTTRFQLWDSVNVPAVGAKLNKVLTYDYNFTGAYKTIKTSLNAKYLVFYYYNTSTDTLPEDEILDSIKICKGTSTEYSPHGQGSLKIYSGNRNILPTLNETKITESGITITPNGDGTYTANGTSTGVISYRITTVDGINSYIHKLPAGKYKGVCENTAYTTHFMQIALKDDILGEKWYNSSPKISFETSGGTYQALIYIRSGVTLNNFVFKPMIILETEENLDYIEHQSQTKALYTQQPFRAIGDIEDCFVKEDSINKERHIIKRHIFNGTETFSKSVSNGLSRYQITFNDINAYTDEARHIDRIMCSHFKVSTNNEYGVIFQYKSSIFFIADFETTEEFKAKLTELYNAGTPLYVDYVLATPTLIECTPEQVKQLESIEKETYSYDEVTNIYSTDEVSPYFEVTAYQRISEEFKTRLKEGKITRGYLKVLATDTLPEIIIDENNYLKDLKIEELRYVPEEGIIGGTVAKRVSGNFNNVDSSFDIQDREIEVYLGVELEDETTEYIKYGTYIVQRPEDDQVNDNTSFEALDYMIKFNQEYKDRITYPCTLKQLLDDIIDQAGVNSKVATFANSDFIVENNQFEQGSTLRDVLKAITQIAFNWSRIDADDNLVMDFEIREETDEELGTDDYFSFKKSDDYGPVNVVVLRNSQVEGENVTIKDEELINLPTNKNICPNDWIYGQYAPLDGSIGIYENRIRQKKLLKVKPNTEYYLNTFNDDYKIIIRTFLKDKTFSRNIGTLTPFMTNSEEYYIGVTIYSPSDNIAALLELVNDNTIKPFICLNSEEDKTYIPFKAVGEIEYVIADNPFAYTELKRKELIEAGRRLFGLKYTPMTVDMLGLMYLNSKDRISVENLNGQKYSTYLFDHTIDYTGIVLDSMESKAKTKTETKYQYISSLAQGLSHVEIRVDKANKKIEAVIQDQQDISEKVAKSISRVEVVYALSDSPTKAPADGWSTTAPEWEEEKYMWQKTVTIYANGTTVESAATNISGAKGEDGLDGIGISSIIEQYYLSTSNTEQTGGSWKETQDSWAEGYYIWTRSKITWEDKSITYSDPILAEVLNNLNEDTKIIKNTLVKQESTTQGLLTTVSETTEKLNTQYLTTDEVNKKINDATSPYEELEKRVTTVETTAKGVQTNVTTIQNNGVNKVTTTTGYTFDDVGLTISKTGKEMTTQITEDGMDIYRDKGEITEEKVLEANSSGVYAYDLHAKTFLIVGESSRFEDYIKNNKKRTGCFWIGETEV